MQLRLKEHWKLVALGLALGVLALRLTPPVWWSRVYEATTLRETELKNRVGHSIDHRRRDRKVRPSHRVSGRTSELYGVDRLGNLWGYSVLDEDAMPEHEHEHRPELATTVVLASLVLVEHREHRPFIE